jgi:hypothetical protein
MSSSADASQYLLRYPLTGRRRRCSSLRPSPSRWMIQADLLTCGAGKRTEGSDRPGESSLSAVCDFPSSYISGAEAATERSEGVAGAERYQGPGDPLLESSGRAQQVCRAVQVNRLLRVIALGEAADSIALVEGNNASLPTRMNRDRYSSCPAAHRPTSSCFCRLPCQDSLPSPAIPIPDCLGSTLIVVRAGPQHTSGAGSYQYTHG